jgi:hypothetical protein
MEGAMSTVERKRVGRMSMLDTALVAFGVLGAVLAVLWLAGVVAHLVLLAFKIAILVVVVAVVIRLIHLFTRGRD